MYSLYHQVAKKQSIPTSNKNANEFRHKAVQIRENKPTQAKIFLIAKIFPRLKRVILLHELQ